MGTTFRDLVIASLISLTFVDGVLLSTCYEYETYCLFSFGPNVTVNNVKEAQKICEDARRGSWLLEITSDRMLKNLKEFVSNNSFPEDVKIILNCEKVENGWRWIKDKSECNMENIFSKDDRSVKFYCQSNQTGNITNEHFLAICMTDCYSKLTKHEGKRFLHGVGFKNKTANWCLKKCETHECEAWEWDSKGCWIHKTIKEKKISESQDGTLYVMDRSVKKFETCKGINYISGVPYIKSKTLGIKYDLMLASITLSILLLLITSIAAAIFCQRLQNRRTISESRIAYYRSKKRIKSSSTSLQTLPKSNADGSKQNESSPASLQTLPKPKKDELKRNESSSTSLQNLSKPKAGGLTYVELKYPTTDDDNATPESIQNKENEESIYL